MRAAACVAGLVLASTSAGAVEQTVKNDSLVDFSAGVIQAGFVEGEKAASWLTSPCNGNVVAVQVFWRSLFGTAPFVIGDSIDILRAGTFPTPGALAVQIGGPVLTDGVLNEYRYLDENNTIPVSVPVTTGERFVVAYTFSEAPTGLGPSVVNDTDGNVPNSNAIYARLGPGTFFWFSSQTLGVTGDWVIRAVVDCPVAAGEADVSAAIAADPSLYTAGAPLSYTITVANAGPSAAPGVVVFDAFPAAYLGATWTCAASGGATCTSGGSGNITQPVSLPAGAQVVYTVNGTVAPGTTGILSNTVTAVVSLPTTDPDGSNNSATVDSAADTDRIFADGFDPAP